MSTKELLNKFHEIVVNPAAQKDAYLAAGKKIVLCAPVYTPEEIIHSMGAVPFGAWGEDMQINEAKKYFPAFICSIMQTILEMGMKGAYKGASAIVIPSLCDSLKVLGENWKYAVKDIPFVPMTYPQNRKPAYGVEYTKAGYERVIKDVANATGLTFTEDKLSESIKIYNEHNKVMREFAGEAAKHGEITVKERSDVFKSAFFMLKEEHTAMVKELLASMKADNAAAPKVKVVTSGILADSPAFLDIFDEFGLTVVADDIAAESRQYRTDASEACPKGALHALAEKFANMDNCSVLYDVEKKRVKMIADMAEQNGAKGVIIVLTKFCDPEEFDYPLIKKECEKRDIPIVLVEVDRQMENFEQARTMIETFAQM